MNVTSLEYEDQVRGIAVELAVQFWKGTQRAPEDVMQSADEFACYIANGMSCEQYKELQGEEFNVYKRHKAMDDDDG
jgi:hypothetical protein